ncbi:MAG: arsenic resistance N-acetyltransferase ArsN2 [Caldilineaceae bacterium]
MELEVISLTPVNTPTSTCGTGCCSPDPSVLNLEDPDAVRSLVRDHYGERVRNAQSCCGPSNIEIEGDWGVSYYSQDQLAAIPEEAALVSYGCGNPTALATLRPGEIVLDLGSGGGIDCFLAARNVGSTGYVYGVDMTDEMLELANRNKAKVAAHNVEFRKGTIENLPLPNETVDVIISNCVVNLSPDKEAVIRDAFRVLRPGGRIAISDVVIDGDLNDLPVSEVQLRTALSWAGCIAGALTIDQFKTYFTQAGFEAIDVQVTKRYDLASLGISPDAAQQLLPGADAEALAQRFTSSMIYARKPASVTIAAAQPADQAWVEALLQRCSLPTDGVGNALPNGLVAYADGHLVGSAVLEIYGKAALLRSVAVYPALRGTGLGHRLVRAALELAKAKEISELYLLTTSAGDFFARFGFKPIERTQVQDEVKQSIEFQSACPESALVMRVEV